MRDILAGVITTFGAAPVVVPIPHPAPLTFGATLGFLVITLAVAFATRRKASLALGAIVIAGPFDFAFSIGPTTLTLPKAILLGTILGLALRRASLRPLLARDVRPLAGGAAAIVLATAASALPATYIDATARETLKALEYFATFACACLAFADDPDEATLWKALGVATVLVCLLALVQDVTTAPSGIVLHGHTVPRIAGPLEGPNQLAGWFDLVIPLLAARALLGTRTVLFASLAVLAALTDTLTLSRSGYIALVPGLALVAGAAYRAGLRRRLALAALCAFAPAGALFALFSARGLHEAVLAFRAWASPATGELRLDDGLAPRAQLWHAALKLWATDPALGIGAGNYELLTPKAGLIGVRTHANNLYLQALAEGGVLLFAATVWTLVAALAVLARSPRRVLSVGIGAATVTLAVHQCLDDLSFYPKVGALWWALLGAGAATAVPSPERAASHA